VKPSSSGWQVSNQALVYPYLPPIDAICSFSIGLFDEYAIQQAPSATFKVPIVSDQITILAVSEKKPTFYDFCLADASYNTVHIP
jgi:hypothetical protein